jgi:cupin fold WbuC family metalloprotein
MKIIDNNLLDSITVKAKQNKRLRINYNLHDSLDDKVQKLLNALEPGTDLPIHRHQNTSETYVLIRGSLRVLFYNQERELVDFQLLSLKEGTYGVDIPCGQWHSIEVLESGTVILEVKEGPYQVLNPENVII